MIKKPHKGMMQRRYCYLSLLLAGLIVGLVCSWLYVYDPFQIYHKPYLRELAFSDQMRVQARGIIKNYDFDSFIIGDSLNTNTSAAYANRVLGGKWVNISMPGSSIEEKFVVLQYLFANQTPRQIIYGLQLFWGVLQKNDMSGFGFLYDSNPFNDIKLYINRKFIGCALLWSNRDNCIGYAKELEGLMDWSKRNPIDAKTRKIEDWFKDAASMKEAITKLSSIQKIQKIPLVELNSQEKEALQKYVFDLVQKHPQTQSDFLIPVYSTLFYQIQTQEGIAKYEAMLRYVVLHLSKYPNAKIYALGNLAYADHVGNYQDYTHFNKDMNHLQIDAIATKQYLLNPNNIDAYLKEMEKKIRDFDSRPLVNSLQRAYESRY